MDDRRAAGDVAQFARTGGYLTRGQCPAGVEPLGKLVAAAMGDTVEVTTADVVVDRQLLPRTTPLRTDSHGRPLPQLAGYRAVLGSGEVWLVAEGHGRSFDSRYFGPVLLSTVLTVVQPLYTW